MKKYILLPLAAAVMLAGCTTKEQDQQIRTFWMKQYMNVMVKLMSKKMDSLPQAARQKLAVPQGRTGGQNVHQPQRTQPAPQPQQPLTDPYGRPVAPKAEETKTAPFVAVPTFLRGQN